MPTISNHAKLGKFEILKLIQVTQNALKNQYQINNRTQKPPTLEKNAQRMKTA
jgi:hypothetical protein